MCREEKNKQCWTHGGRHQTISETIVNSLFETKKKNLKRSLKEAFALRVELCKDKIDSSSLQIEICKPICCTCFFVV